MWCVENTVPILNAAYAYDLQTIRVLLQKKADPRLAGEVRSLIVGGEREEGGPALLRRALGRGRS